MSHVDPTSATGANIGAPLYDGAGAARADATATRVTETFEWIYREGWGSEYLVTMSRKGNRTTSLTVRDDFGRAPEPTTSRRVVRCLAALLDQNGEHRDALRLREAIGGDGSKIVVRTSSNPHDRRPYQVRRVLPDQTFVVLGRYSTVTDAQIAAEKQA